MRSSWRPATSGVPQELILLNIFINDGTGHTLRRSADVTKLGGVGNTSYGCAAIQRDLSRVEKWVNRILLKFKKGKCQVLHLGRKGEAPQEVLKHCIWPPFFFCGGPSNRSLPLHAFCLCFMQIQYLIQQYSKSWCCFNYQRLLFPFRGLWQLLLDHGRVLQFLMLKRLIQS